MERNLLAVSLKHSKLATFENLIFWGIRTKDDEQRSYSGYSYAHNAELYTIEEFKKAYNVSYMDFSKVYKTIDLLGGKGFRELKEKFDTIFIDYYDFIECSMKYSDFYSDKFTIDLLKKEIEQLKSKLPQKAHWKVLYKDNQYDTHFECSNCGKKYRVMDSQLESLGFENYCGNCGRNMVEGELDEN